MEVGKDAAAALEVPPEIAPGDREKEKEEVVEGAAPLPAGDAPPSPEAAQPDAAVGAAVSPGPAPMEAAPHAKVEDDEVPIFRPSPLRWLLVAPFWAGLLGSGAGLWLGGLLGASVENGLLSRSDGRAWVWLVFVAAILAAMVRGYREPVRSYAGLVGRFFGALFFGSLLSTVFFFCLVVIAEGQHLREAEMFPVMTFLGAIMGGLALARLYGIGADRSRRIKIAAGALGVLLVSSWPASPALRCRLGFGQGCRAAADQRRADGDLRAAGSLGARGCADEDGLSCRIAGLALETEGNTQDLRRAEGLFREGCALGDDVSCERVHAIELEQRCARYGAFACIELAQAHASGDGVPRDMTLAQRYYRKACLLGADDACAQAGAR